MLSARKLGLEADAVARRIRARIWPRSFAKRRPLRDHLASLFKREQIDCVFDVGANRGQYYRFLRYELGYAGLIVSCEPIAYLANDLATRATIDSNWMVMHTALGSSAGEATINVMEMSEFSSLLAPDHAHTTVGKTENIVARTELIRVRTFADLIDEIARTRPIHRAYLKLDTQGFDLEVVRGAGSALARVVALQTELSFVPIYVGMPDWQAMLLEVGRLGFDVSGFFPVTHDERQRLIEADAVCVRRIGPAK